jgi:hypothetical protein
MSTWTAPITWANAAVTAAQMNAEIRDHCTFLKGALDLLTNSTTADTGTATYLYIFRAADTDQAFAATVTGDSVTRFLITAEGGMTWGDGTATRDVSLDRTAAGTLTVADTTGTAATATLRIEANTGDTARLHLLVTGDANPRLYLAGDSGIGLYMGDGTATVDTNLYRSAANTLKSDDGLWATGGIVTKTKAGAPSDSDLEAGMQQSGAMILDTTNSRIYFRVGSTWKYAALT